MELQLFIIITIIIILIIMIIIKTIIMKTISYGGAAAVPDRSIVSALTGVYLDSLYYLGAAGMVMMMGMMVMMMMGMMVMMIMMMMGMIIVMT